MTVAAKSARPRTERSDPPAGASEELRIGGRHPRAATGHLAESEAKARLAAFEMRAEPYLKMLLPVNDLACILAFNGFCLKVCGCRALYRQQAGMQKLGASSAIHGSFKSFKAVDLPLRLAIAPMLSDRISHGVDVPA